MPGGGVQPSDVLVDVDAHHFVGGQEAVRYPLLQAVGIYRFVKVGEVGNIFGFLGGGGQAELDGAGESIRGFRARPNHLLRCRGGTRR